MKKSILKLLVILILIGSTIFPQEPQNTEKEFIPLLTDSELTGWYCKDGDIDSWQFKDGILSCIKKGGGWLTTDKEYENFLLRLEWRIPAGGNSGVGVRYPKKGDPAHAGMEIQVLDDNAEKYKDLKPAQYTGGIYYQVPAKRGFTKPVGEWNRYEITCDGPLVTVELNGETIVEANMDEHTEGHGGHVPLSKRPRKGHVGVQSHDTRVDYRNIRIKELP